MESLSLVSASLSWLVPISQAFAVAVVAVIGLTAVRG